MSGHVKRFILIGTAFLLMSPVTLFAGSINDEGGAGADHSAFTPAQGQEPSGLVTPEIKYNDIALPPQMPGALPGNPPREAMTGSTASSPESAREIAHPDLLRINLVLGVAFAISFAANLWFIFALSRKKKTSHRR